VTTPSDSVPAAAFRGERRRSVGRFLLAGVPLLGLTAVLLLSGPGASHPLPGDHMATVTQSGTAPSALTLGITASPHSICALGQSTCGAGTGFSRVTLTANAANAGVLAWPNVQVAFVIETTLFDGVYDPTAGEPGNSCAAGSSGMPCEESNGVPFFVQNAQNIANAIQQANPHSQVSFAMVDYFYTCNFDDCDGKEYHVDLPQFVGSGEFGTDVKATFQTQVLGGGFYYFDSDFADNILHSSAITAMYGTIVGSGLNWANNTHHVIVWMGSTAPRDPMYPENYCVSPQLNFGGNCQSATCEPSYAFATGVSPNCEGWVRSQDGNATHSIAALAKTAKQCTGSIGGVCTVDAIDLYDTATDPYSKDWPTGRTGGGPGGVEVQKDVANVLKAGCDISAATGGTWNGPAWYTCANGQAGGLQYVAHGSYDKPNTANPTLFAALRTIGFGPVIDTQVASGSNRPIFQFVPFGNIAIAPAGLLQASAACYRGGLPLKSCQVNPSFLRQSSTGLVYLGWNWSTNKTTNVMYVGDQWTATFNVEATGPPYTTVPVDACITAACHTGGSGTNNGIFTSATFVPFTNNSVVTESFPLTTVVVEITPAGGAPPVAPPPPPPVPPGIPIVAPTGIPVIQQLGIGNTVGIANVSLQATAAGFLGAGFMRVSLKNRPIAMKVAAKSGVVTSKFEKASQGTDSGLGHFE